jgi:hypothetical protein
VCQHLYVHFDEVGKISKNFESGGRREPVKSVLSTLPTYLLTVIKPLKKFYKDLDKMRRRFFWVGDQEIHGGKCKVNWSRVCRSLKNRGVGLTGLECFSRALRVCWMWYKWKKLDKPWFSSDIPVDSTDEALLPAAT